MKIKILKMKNPAKTNTLKQRLKVYKKALEDFSKPINNYTDCGFCHYFNTVQGIYVYRQYFKLELPELWRYRPKSFSMFWFYSKSLEPRVQCLKKAIKYTEKLILKQNKNVK